MRAGYEGLVCEIFNEFSEVLENAVRLGLGCAGFVKLTGPVEVRKAIYLV